MENVKEGTAVSFNFSSAIAIGITLSLFNYLDRLLYSFFANSDAASTISFSGSWIR